MSSMLMSAAAGSASATIRWTAPSNGGSAITSYTVTPHAGTAAQTPVTVTGTPPATAATITGLVNGTTYTFTVTAANAIGTSAASTASSPVTPTAPATSMVANGGFESALTSWTTGGAIAPRPATRAHSGAGSALLGVTSGREPLGDSTLSQTVTVPAGGRTTLSIRYETATGPTCRHCSNSTTTTEAGPTSPPTSRRSRARKSPCGSTSTSTAPILPTTPGCTSTTSL